jgi:hypothetical protein
MEILKLILSIIYLLNKRYNKKIKEKEIKIGP